MIEEDTLDEIILINTETERAFFLFIESYEINPKVAVIISHIKQIN